MTTPPENHTPQIRPAGLDGVLVTFADALTEPANRAALAFAAELARRGLDGIEEAAPSLVSVYLRFDPLHLSFTDLSARLRGLLQERDWYAAPMPGGRRLIRVPAVFGTDLAPQLDEAAEAAGFQPDEAIASICRSPLRVQTIGFAPGQPYLGLLPKAWDIPRQTDLTRAVPEGALVVAIRQITLFSVSSPTGWRHVGQTALKLFQPNAEEPFLLRPGDEVQFCRVSRERFETLRAAPASGIEIERLP
ncbi:carboxyltransferase domain-containing protein [Marivita sp. GX14005]|uniref:5-oxoprolinase subunit B family protein n=1 Tax=Marivita sp. GX14005 TaxID=2942276 RepID=UPI0020197FD6|nr:carboxyltransferase domain-containing protein [Marivita sp. GX14005]MCL3882341.1 allophanate hydrolase subunit 1 [Marivita sp. GX14005]